MCLHTIGSWILDQAVFYFSEFFSLFSIQQWQSVDFPCKNHQQQLCLSPRLRDFLFIFPEVVPMWLSWYWAAGQIIPWSNICGHIDQHHFHCFSAQEVYLVSEIYRFSHELLRLSLLFVFSFLFHLIISS